MQIHELDTYSGSYETTDYLAVDDGTETLKVAISDVGITTEMTLTEAQAGTETEPRVITPAVLYSFAVDKADGNFELDTTATSGDDYNLYSVITTLGWESDVIA